jgi:hypothetical protein
VRTTLNTTAADTRQNANGKTGYPGQRNAFTGRTDNGSVRRNTITVPTVSPKKIQSAKTT